MIQKSETTCAQPCLAMPAGCQQQPKSLALHARHLERVRHQLGLLQAGPLAHGYEYPWHGLNEKLEQGEFISVAGYGSLMNRNSAARTFTGTAVEQGCPVVVFHARRVYDYVMSQEARQRYQATFPETHCGVLNAYVTGNPDDWFNAVALKLSIGDIEAFRKREYGYDLLPVITLDWHAIQQDQDCEPGVAYVLSCRNPLRAGRQMTLPNLQPHPLYHELCLEGARSISADFLETFHQTTQISFQSLQPDSPLLTA